MSTTELPQYQPQQLAITFLPDDKSINDSIQTFQPWLNTPQDHSHSTEKFEIFQVNEKEFLVGTFTLTDNPNSPTFKVLYDDGANADAMDLDFALQEYNYSPSEKEAVYITGVGEHRNKAYKMGEVNLFLKDSKSKVQQETFPDVKALKLGSKLQFISGRGIRYRKQLAGGLDSFQVDYCNNNIIMNGVIFPCSPASKETIQHYNEYIGALEGTNDAYKSDISTKHIINDDDSICNADFEDFEWEKTVQREAQIYAALDPLQKFEKEDIIKNIVNSLPQKIPLWKKMYTATM